MEVKERRKMFFFEKKNQKTFVRLSPSMFHHLRPRLAKVFCRAFFQKSDRLL